MTTTKTYALHFLRQEARPQFVVRDEAGHIKRFETFAEFAQHLKALARTCSQEQFQADLPETH